MSVYRWPLSILKNSHLIYLGVYIKFFREVFNSNVCSQSNLHCPATAPRTILCDRRGVVLVWGWSGCLFAPVAVLSDRMLKDSWWPLLWAKVKKVRHVAGWVTGSRSTMKENAIGIAGATGKRHKSERPIKLGAEHPDWLGFYKRDKHKRYRWDMSGIVALFLVKHGGGGCSYQCQDICRSKGCWWKSWIKWNNDQLELTKFWVSGSLTAKNIPAIGMRQILFDIYI